MDKTKFRVIMGNKPHPHHIKYHFIEAFATNTRLMGVMGLIIHWKNQQEESFHQFFHLDAEEYGIDDYEGLSEGAPSQIENYRMKMMGGLGGEFVDITEGEARYLVHHFADKNKEFLSPMPAQEEEFGFILKEEATLCDEETKNLWEKVCEKIRSSYHAINYFLMRSIGADYDGARYLSTQELDFRPVKKSSTLLKNVIETMEEDHGVSYITESLVDMGDQYKMVISEFRVTDTQRGPKISHAEIKSIMHITSTEAAFTLTKKEYLLVYEIENVRDGIKLLDQRKPHAMKNGYDIGFLYTEFNQTNDHVDRQTYFLNDDIYGVYYITAGEQLIVAAYSKDRIEVLEEYFSRNGFEDLLVLEEHMELDQSMLYEFVHSEYENFYDFLDQE